MLKNAATTKVEKTQKKNAFQTLVGAAFQTCNMQKQIIETPMMRKKKRKRR